MRRARRRQRQRRRRLVAIGLAMVAGAVGTALLVSAGRASPDDTVSARPPIRPTTTTAPAARRTTTTTAVVLRRSVRHAVRATTTTTAAPTTTTPGTATLATEPRPDRKTCLDLALLNHLRVVGANQEWYQQQLRALAARHLIPSPQYVALQIEQANTQDEIEAQYAIGQSNCYVGRAAPIS